MNDDSNADSAPEQHVPALDAHAQHEQALEPDPRARIPQYRRNLVPRNLTLSADDLREFAELLAEANERSKHIEFQHLNMTEFENEAQAQGQLNELMPIEYNYTASSGDNVRGLGIPDTASREFPNDLRSFFISNSSFAQQATNTRPLNSVDVFLDFQTPSLKIDLLNPPSNPTENKTIINVYGANEDWVISTANRIQEFFKDRNSFRPAIHGSGTYDYFIFIIFIPFGIWFYTKSGGVVDQWAVQQSILFNVILGVYLLLLSLLFARFLFQYVRWLFPPMEYYKKNRIGASIHRGVATFLGLAIIAGATYDIGKAVLQTLFG